MGANRARRDNRKRRSSARTLAHERPPTRGRTVRTAAMCSTEKPAEPPATCKCPSRGGWEGEREGARMSVCFPPPAVSLRPVPPPGAEDQAPSVPGGASRVRDVEGGLLPERGLVRLVHGTRDRVGGRLAPRLRVGPFFIYYCY